MSTRANIIIKDKYTTLYFYRHSDGHPEGTLPTLELFLEWLKKGKIRDNPSQAAGWLILIGAAEYNPGSDYAIKNAPKTINWQPDEHTAFHPWKVGAYEPVSRLSMDADYHYIIDLDSRDITVKQVDRTTFEQA